MSLWEHQVRALSFLDEHAAALLYLGMGSGKTRIAAEALARPNHLPALVLTRSAVITDGVWERECERLGLEASPLTGPIARRANELTISHARGANLFLTNYEGAWREPLAAVIKRIPWRTVILDECHAIASPGSKVSWFAKSLARTPYRIGLSGTPMKQTPLDIYGQFRFLDGSIFGTSFQRFKARYAICENPNLPYVVTDYVNQDELMRRFWRVAFRVPPEELKLSLPEDFDIPLVHEVPASARALYREMETEFYAEVGESSVTIANAGVKILRLQQLAAGHTRDDDGQLRTIHTARADRLKDFLEDVDSIEPVVIFARFKHDLSEVERVARELNRPYSEVSGRADGLNEWKEGKTTILGVQIQSGSEGINLTRACLGVYFSVGHSLFQFQQSRARLVRPGQTRPVRFFHLTAGNTVDQRVYGALKRGEDVIKSFLALPMNIEEGALIA